GAARHGDEAIEIPRATAVPDDRVAAAEQPGHHGLRHAGRERGCDRRVGRGSTLGEDLDAGPTRTPMSPCDRRRPVLDGTATIPRVSRRATLPVALALALVASIAAGALASEGAATLKVAYVTDFGARPDPHDLRGAALLGFRRAVKKFRVQA